MIKEEIVFLTLGHVLLEAEGRFIEFFLWAVSPILFILNMKTNKK